MSDHSPAWASRIRAAAAARAAADAIEEQTIRDAVAGGASAVDVAALLGVKNRQRVIRIKNAAPDEPVRPPMPDVVYLRGPGNSQGLWERMHRAMWSRGWQTVTNHEMAWHSARGGARVVLVDFSRRSWSISVMLVRARYGERRTVGRVSDLFDPADLIPHLGQPWLDHEAVIRTTEHQLVPLKGQPNPIRPRPTVAPGGSVLDVDAVARMVGELLTVTADAPADGVKGATS